MVAETLPFQDFFQSPTRNGLTRPKAVRGEGVKMVNMGEIFAYGRISNLEMDRVPLSEREEAFLLEPGDLLFARQSLVLEGAGKCSIFLGDNEPVTFESHIIRVRLNKSIADPRFFYYFFNSPIGRGAIRTIVEQVAAAGIRSSDLAKLMVPAIPLRSQQIFSHILSTFDEKIELNEEMNETIEAMGRALFDSWFVRYLPVRAKTENLEHDLPKNVENLFPEQFEDSELGPIPAGWKVKTIMDVAERVAMGPFGANIKVETFASEGVPIITGQHLRGFMVDDTKFNFITPEHAKKLQNAVVQRGDIVVTHRGNLGQAAIVPESSQYENYVISQSQFFMRCDQSQITPTFMAFYFNSPTGQHRLLANTSSSGVPAIARPVTYLRSIKIVVPEKKVLDQFEKTMNPLLMRFGYNKEMNRTLSALRDMLLPRLMSGQLNVADPARFMESLN